MHTGDITEREALEDILEYIEVAIEGRKEGRSDFEDGCLLALRNVEVYVRATIAAVDPTKRSESRRQ